MLENVSYLCVLIFFLQSLVNSVIVRLIAKIKYKIIFKYNYSIKTHNMCIVSNALFSCYHRLFKLYLYVHI